MKALFLSFVTFLAGTAALAQKFEIGLNGGGNYLTKPAIIPGKNFYGSYTNSGFSVPVAAVKALLNYKKWQFGLQGGYTQLSYKASALFTNFDYPGPYFPVFISKTAIPVKVFVNRKITLGKFENYGGASAGYILAKDCADMNALAPPYFNQEVDGHGFSAGLQAGTTYFVSRHFGFNAEVGCDYMNVTPGAATYKLFAFPCAVGVRYKF